MGWTDRFKTLVFGAAPVPGEESTTLTFGKAGEAEAVTARWRMRYRVVRELGEGGMGKVMLAERLSDGRAVCLKFLHADTDRASGEQECRALMRLRHPAIVSLLDFSLEDKPPWLVTEFAPGQTLRAFMKEHGALDKATVLALLKTLFGALDYAHSQSVIHRDLKPENIMIDPGVQPPAVRVLDFGIAIVDRVDHGGNITAKDAAPLGTIRYMAPEQLRGELLTAACDVYALGLIAYELITGRELFQGRKPHELMFEKITRSAGYTVDGEQAPVSADLNGIVEACTRPDPASRISAREATVAIEAMR